MNESYEKLKSILSDMFQLNQSDLDFGIYRIMNYKRSEVEKFLNEDLLPQVKNQLERYVAVEQKALKDELRELKSRLQEDEVPLESSPKYIRLKAKLDHEASIEEAESDVYSHLASFFGRYYKEGDFISLRRYKKDVYAIPYEGEEVKLHWANSDQYYIKTAEYFRDYAFKLENGKKVHFKIVEADTEKDNNNSQEGKERRFVLNDGESVIIENNELIIKFQYKIDNRKQKDLIDDAIKTVREITQGKDDYKEFELLFVKAPTEKNMTIFEKYLNDYTSRNTFDYFIHKDLGGFLRRELDFYIKNEVMYLDDIDTENEVRFEQYLTKVKVIKNIGEKIIQFLEQIENFQKKLWLKKKFIYDTNYCITLDKIPEEYYKDIIKNEAQLDEWVKLFSIDEIKGDSTKTGFIRPLTEAFLKQNPYLVLDTAFFDEKFKEKILSEFNNIDEQTDGVLIHSENFQALNLIFERFKEQVKCCYIDPPYNTNASKIIYKNGYEHSSWISLMNDRLLYTKKLLSKNGIIEVAIDDYELRNLNMLMDNIFGDANFISNIAILTNPKGRDQEYIAQAHDYNVIYSKDKRYAETNYFTLSEEELNKKYSLNDGKEIYRELPLKRTGSEKWRKDRPFMFFPFIYNAKGNVLSILPKNEYEKLYDKEQEIFNDEFLLFIKKEYESNGNIFILPVDENGAYLRWRWGYDSCKKGIEEGSVFVKETRKGTYNIYEKNMGDKYYTPKSLWTGERYDASSKGTNLLKSIVPNNIFDYPKSLYTVMDSITIGANDDSLVIDFFAGSGTTAQAIIELNRSDNGNRKYILVEMGSYFDNVTRCRTERVIYSKDWKDGKPISREGSSQLFKYFRLESYEDALNNLEINISNEQLNIFKNNPALKEKYMLSYMLNKETEGSMSLLNIDKFKNPFDYKLKIIQNLESSYIKIDFVETFNYLIGLVVDRIEMKEYFKSEIDSNGVVMLQKASNSDYEYVFKVVEGKTILGEKALIIWRNMTNDIVKDNASLDAYFNKKRYSAKDFEYDRIFVNGDNNIPNLALENDTFKVTLIEEEFKKRMFDAQGI